jgi:hypothetical protein
MTPKQFINELFGEDWKPSQLPVFLDQLKVWADDAQRYYVLRDYAKDIEWGAEPRIRVKCRVFDDYVDAKRFEHELE